MPVGAPHAAPVQAPWHADGVRCSAWRTDGHSAQAFAAGAMLTMLADVIMPEAFAHGGKAVGLLPVPGFLIAAVLSVVE